MVESGDVRQYVKRVMHLTRGKLLKQADWDKWQDSEFLQLDQYDAQGMSGDPVAVNKDDSIFYLVWTYGIKTLDGHKKARCMCDGSTRFGSVKVLDETYANCVDQTISRLFYALSAGENLLVFGADVSNATEAPPPNKTSTSDQIKLFMIGGYSIKAANPSQRGTLYLLSRPCKATLNRPAYWENTLTLSSGGLD